MVWFGSSCLDLVEDVELVFSLSDVLGAGLDLDDDDDLGRWF